MTQSLPTVLEGIVTVYKGNGRKLGYPTANISSDTALPDGVYFGHVDLSDYRQRPALIFIGTPTTMGDTERRVETHVLDAEDRDYYGMRIKISVEKFHRENQTFASIDDLLIMMKADEVAGRTWARTVD